MKTEKILLAVTIAAATALTRFRLVDFTGAVAGAGERALGVANMDYDSGEQAGVATHGEILVEAGAAVAVGVQVESDASGRVITYSAGVPFGVARDAASAAGDIIRVLR
jgi:hypothetical protein